MSRAAAEPVEISAWLADEGFLTKEARSVARKLLEAAGITNPRKRAMAVTKLDHARDVLARHVVRACDGCWDLATAAEGQVRVESDAANCSVCAGSNNRRAAEEMIAACERAGLRRLLVVGGTGATHQQLASLLRDSAIELRLVDGKEQRPTRREALADLAWGDLLVLWASTPLPHKSSMLYTGPARELPIHMITVSRRGVAALCDEVTKSLARHSTRP